MPSSQVLYISIAEEMTEKIKAGEWRTDQKLPSERELAEQYGVGRNVVREALKVLSEKCLVRVVTGKGNYVTAPGNEFLQNRMEEALDYSRFKQKDIIDAREAIEMAIARATVENATPQQVKLLRDIYWRMEEALENRKAFTEEDAQFHLAIADCSGNAVLKMMTITLNNVTDRAAFHHSQKNNDFSRHAQKEHKDMVDAIARKDLDMLKDAIWRHIQCLRENIIEQPEEFADSTDKIVLI